MANPAHSQPKPTQSPWSPTPDQGDSQSQLPGEATQTTTNPYVGRPFVLPPPPPSTPPSNPNDTATKPKPLQRSFIDLTQADFSTVPPEPPSEDGEGLHVSAASNPVLQTKCAACEAEEAKEADKETTVQASPSPSFSTLYNQLNPISPTLQRKAISKPPIPQPSHIDLTKAPLFPQPTTEAPTIQRQAKTGAGNASVEVEDAIQHSLGQGKPLADPLREQMEGAIGADFSEVRVHTDSQADGLNQSLQAKAFTTGQDIYFKQGEFKPGSQDGQALLAHELTHVVQQSGAQGLMVQRDEDDTYQKARRHALNIKEALLDGWTEDEEEALRQIRDQSVLMLKEIRAQYKDVTGGNSLEADFKEYCSSGEYKEALSWLNSTLSIEDKIRTNIDKGWLFDSENETGMLEVLRQASQSELNRAGQSESLLMLLRDSLDDDEYYEARKLLTPNKMYELVVERIRSADGWVNDDEDATYSVLLDLTVEQRRTLWTENDPDNTDSTLFSFMSHGERASVRVMCLGSEATALQERMDIATTGLGTDDDAVKLVVEKTKTAAQQEQAVAQMLKTGKASDGKPLTVEQLAKLQAQYNALGGIQKNLLTAERDGASGELKSGTFLEMLHGDVSEAEFQAFTTQIGVSQFERAKQQILDAIGFFNDDEAAIYKAFDQAVGAIEVPLGTEAAKLTPEERAQLQQKANRKLRELLLKDKAIKQAMGHLSQGEKSIVETYASSDTYQIAVEKLKEAYYGLDTDEEAIFKILTQMSAGDRQRLHRERPTVYMVMLSPFRTALTRQERRMVQVAVKTGKIPTDTALDWAFGNDWDGTEDEMLEQTFAAMDETERYQYRLGYYLFKGGKGFAQKEAGQKAEQAALKKFQQLYRRMESELGTDDLQKALDQLLGTPTLEELKSEQGRMMAAQIMRNRVSEKGDIREDDTVSSAIMDTFSDEGEVSDQAEVQFESAYKLAIADDKLTAEEFAALAALDANFAQKYDEYVATVDQVANIASTVAAIAVGIAAVILSGGSGAPAVAALLSKFGVTATTAQSVATAAALAGTASATFKVGVSELVGGSHYDAASTEGLQDAAVGFTEGAMAVVAAGLAARFTKLVGLGKTELAGEMTAGILASSEAAATQAGRTFARAGLEGLIDGFLSGAVGELVMTATDKAVWKQSIWDVVLSFGRAILKGAGIGAVTGVVTGGSLEALTTYVGVKRLQGFMKQLDAIGINEERLSNLSVDAVKGLGKADAALAAGKLDEAEAAFKSLENVLGADELSNLRSLLHNQHSEAIQAAAVQGLKQALVGKGDVARQARTAIANIRDFKQLRAMVKRGDFGDPVAAQQALQEARMKIIEEEVLKGVIQPQLAAKYPGISIDFKNLGTLGFGSDCDITIQVTGGANVSDDIAASVEGVRDTYKELRRRGLDPDTSLDANFYTELHEASIKASPKEADQIIQDQSVVSLAEMRMNMADEQWEAYKQAQLTSLGKDRSADGLQGRVEAEARQRLQGQLEEAEQLAGKLQAGDRETVLADRQEALLQALQNGAPAPEIRQRMAEIKLLEPDAYGTRAAVEGVVDYQQRLARGTAADYMKFGRNLPKDQAGRFAVLTQEASPSLAKMFSHAKAGGGNSVSDVRSLAKYLGRVDQAFYEAGLDTGSDLIKLKNLLMAAKHGDSPDADTLKALRKWGKQTNREDLSDQALQDAWVQEAQALAQEMVVKMRSAEQVAYVMRPKAPGSTSPPSGGGPGKLPPAGKPSSQQATPDTPGTGSSPKSSQKSSESKSSASSSKKLIEGAASDGKGRLSVTEDGRIIRCSSLCEDLRILYGRELDEDPALLRRLDSLDSNFQGADPTDHRTLEKLYEKLQRLDDDLQAAYQTRTLTLTSARTEFPSHHSQLNQIEARLTEAGRPELAEVVNDVARLQAKDGRIAGFEDWIDTTFTRDAGDVVNVTAELLEARRIADNIAVDQPDAVIRIGQDSNTSGRSFDITVETPGAGGTFTTQSRIEVQRAGEVRFPNDLMDGIRHGAEKIDPDVISGAAPIPPEAMESTVQINWPPSGPTSTIDGDITYALDGSYQIPNSQNPGYTGNFVRDLVAGNNGLNGSGVDARIRFLSGINIIDQNGNLIWRLQNSTPGTAAWAIDFIRPR
ncbi:MAG: DUF4157 domain-containing protein [Cyanobacteria bacterium P01_H01_bin.58]